MLIVSLIYVSGAVVDAMVKAQKEYPFEFIYLNFYQLFYLMIIMSILIPLVVYYGSKLSLKIGPRKTVILLLFELPIASALWDITFGWLIHRNPLWIGIDIKDWFTLLWPNGEIVISIPSWFSTTSIILRIVLGIALLWFFFEIILPSKNKHLVKV